MIALPQMLTKAAKDAGIAVPPDPDNFNEKKFPYFNLFCCAQLGQPQPRMGCHFENAHVIAKLPKSKLKTITFKQLQKRGFQIGYSGY
jgi:hypothetical protein